MWTTDLYGRSIHYWSDLWDGIAQHPEWLNFNNWGPQYGGNLIWISLTLLIIAFIIQHLPQWKSRGWPDLIDVPPEYFIAVLPLLLLCAAVVGVGANRAGFGYEQQIPIVMAPSGPVIYQPFDPTHPNGTVFQLWISNYVYHGIAHKSSSMLIGANVCPWNLSGLFGKRKDGKDRLSVGKEWIVIFLILLILFLYWETTENINVHAQGGPRLGYENPQDDSEYDVYSMIEGTLLVFVLYQVTWMVANKRKNNQG